MANKKRTVLTGGEVADIGAQISQVAKGSEGLQMRLQRVLQTSKRMSAGLRRDFSRVHQKLITDTRSQEAAITRLQRQQARGEKINTSRLQQLQKEQQQRRRQIQILDRVNARSETEAGLLSKLWDRMKSLISVSGLLSTAWDILVKAFENWIDLAQKWQSAMGQIAQQTGATAAQFRELRGIVSSTAGTFGYLEGAVDGIELAGQFTGELATAWREMGDITPEFARSILEVSRGFGVGVQGAAQLRRSLEALGIADTTEEFRAFSVRQLEFAQQTGVNAAQMIADWNANASAIATFGQEAESTFREAFLMASRFGLETRRIFESMKGFDTFGQSANKVNELNAVLGTTISSYEIMMEQNLPRRMEMIVQGVRDTGLEWDTMGRQRRMVLAQTLDLTEEEAARIFRNGETMGDIEDARREAAEQQQQDERTAQQNQRMMHSLLRRTATVFETIQRAIQRVWNSLSRLLAPIFKVVNEEVIALIGHFRSWIDGARGTQEISDIIQDVSGWIREAFQWVRRHIPTWEELKEIAKDTWETAKRYGRKAWEIMVDVKDIIIDVYDWLVKQRREWDDGTSTARQYWELITAGGRAAARHLQIVWDIMKGIGTAIEFLIPQVGLLSTGLQAIVGGEGDQEGGTIGRLTRLLNLVGGAGERDPASEDRARAQAEREAIGTARTASIRYIEQRVGQGASYDDVLNEMMERGNTNPLLFRVSGQGQRFSEFVQEHYDRAEASLPEARRRQPPRPTVRQPPRPERGVSATEQRATQETQEAVSRRATVGRGRNQIQIVASDVNIDGRTVGRILFEISERA